MNEKTRILIAYDGSEDADAALADLKRAGLGGDVEALVITVADVFLPPPLDEEPFPSYVPDVVKRAHKRAQHKLDEAKSLGKLASDQIKSAFPTWSVSCDAQADSPAWAIIRTADKSKPDLIVVGARGHSLLGGRLILGSVSQRVLYEALCSVRIARAGNEEQDAPVRVLIGVDHSTDSNAAVDAVCTRHWPKGSEVALLAVVDTVMAVDTDSAKWIDVSEENNWDQVRELFAPAAEKLRNAGLHSEVLIRRGNPADQILQEADTWGAHCIFVGAKGARGIDRLLLGSISSAVSSRARCSVEVVRAKS